MLRVDENHTHHHRIERKGPDSYWVHRFSGSRQSLAQAFSRIVFFARDRGDAERYVNAINNAPEFR